MDLWAHRPVPFSIFMNLESGLCMPNEHVPAAMEKRLRRNVTFHSDMGDPCIAGHGPWQTSRESSLSRTASNYGNYRVRAALASQSPK